MAEKPKYIQDLTTTVALHEDQVANLRRETADLGQKVDTVKEAIANLGQQIALIAQRLDDHVKRIELWDNRRWGLIVLLIGAIFSLEPGLIVTLAKR